MITLIILISQVVLMIKYKDKAKIFVKFLSLLFKEMHVYIMGDDSLYLFFFKLSIFFLLLYLSFPKVVKRAGTQLPFIVRCFSSDYNFSSFEVLNEYTSGDLPLFSMT